MNDSHHARSGGSATPAARQPQPFGGREKRGAPHRKCLIIAALALLVVAGFGTPARAATGAGALARPVGSKACTGGVLNSQFWTVQAGDTVTARITGARDAKPSSGSTVPVLIASDLSLLGNVTVDGTLSGAGTSSATITFTWPYSMGPSCGTAHVAYWGGSAAGFIATNSSLINGKSTPAGWAIVDTACNLVATNPLTGRCYPPLSGVQCPLTSGLLDCASTTSKLESFSFSPGGIIGGQPPYTVTASATNGVAIAPAAGYPGITLSSNALGFSGTFPVGPTSVTVTVTDAVGAATACSFPVLIDHLTVTVADAATCAGSPTTLTAQPAGGSGAYRYAWSGPNSFTASTPTISVSGAGQYTVTVTDSSGCTASNSGTVTVNAGPTASIGAQTNVSCSGGSNGSATVLVSGGQAPYTVTDGTSSQTGAASQTAFTFSNLAANSYQYTVTDANGCTGSTSVTITQPAALTVSPTYDCSGNGSAAISGGTAPYSWWWTDPSDSSFGPATGTGATATISGVGNRTLTVTVTDANQCTASATVSVPKPLLVYANTDGAVSCPGWTTTVRITVQEGTPPYTVSDGTTTQTKTGVIYFPEKAGTYTFMVTDAHGCTASSWPVRITQPDPLTVSTTQTNVSCNGGSNGSATATASGGRGPYSYAWTGPNSFSASGAAINNLAAGTYSLTVTDACGSTSTAAVTITQPTQLVANSSAGTIACHDGTTTVTVSASGGTRPYSGTGTYTVSAGPYSYTVTDANGCTATTSGTITQPTRLVASSSAGTIRCYGDTTAVTVSASGGTAPYSGTGTDTESAGPYSYTVTDANGCTATTSGTISQPDALMLSETHTDVSSSGGSDGSIDLSVSGGTSPYTYAWSNGASSEDLSGLAAGAYTVTVTDARGCQTSTQVTITQPAAPLAVSITGQTNVSCADGSDGSATAAISGGTPPYSWSWTLPGGSLFSPVNGTGPTATATGLSGLPPSLYYMVTATDANGATETATVTITQPLPLIVQVSQAQPTHCYGDSAPLLVTVNGGTPPYKVSYGTTTETGTLNQTHFSFTEPAGSYTFTITDAHGCTTTAMGAVTQPAAPLTVSTTETNVSTAGGSDGSATATGGGGTGPYSYAWTGPNSFSASGATINNLAAGTYTVTVTDAHGCQTSTQVTIN